MTSLGINKGTMELVDEKRQKEIFDYFQSSEPRFNPGGSAPNTILACAALGTHSHISGKIGKDHFADIYLKRVNQYGADSGLVQGNGTTGSSIILVTPDGERSMNTHLGICREYSSDNIDVKKLSRSNYLYFTGYMWDTESQKSAIQKAISVAHENKIKIVFDIADPFVVERNRNEFLELIKNDVDIVFANHVELKILFNSESIEHATNGLIDIVDSAGIKLGKKGSIIFNKKNVVIHSVNKI